MRQPREALRHPDTLSGVVGHLTTRPQGGRVLGRGWARPGLASPWSNPGPGKARLTSLNEWGREGGDAKTLRYMICEIKSKYSNKESQNNISKDVYQGLKLNTDFFINPNTNAIKFCGMLNIIYSGKNVPYCHKPMCTVSLSGCYQRSWLGSGVPLATLLGLARDGRAQGPQGWWALTAGPDGVPFLERGLELAVAANLPCAWARP